jgi:hypothetical protein
MVKKRQIRNNIGQNKSPDPEQDVIQKTSGKERLKKNLKRVRRVGNQIECLPLAVLPKRCVICNKREIVMTKVMSFSWPPWIYFVYLLGVKVIGDTGSIAIHLCKEHKSINTTNSTIGWICILLSFIIPAALVFYAAKSLFIPAFIVFSVLLSIGMNFRRKSKIIKPTYIDNLIARYTGAGPAFLDSLSDKRY